MRRVPLLAMLLVLCGLAVPSSAVADEGILLRGSRTAYVDLYVYENSTLDPASFRITSRGSYVGFFFSPAPANRDTVGALVMPRVGASGATSSDRMKLGKSWDVQAGKYRVFLLTDGPAEIFIPLPGQGFRGYQPRGAAPSSLRPVDFDVAPGRIVAEHETTMRLSRRSLVVAAGRATTSSVASADRMAACVTSGGACSTTYSFTARFPGDARWSYGAELVPPGDYSGVLDLTRLAGVDAGTHVAGAVLVVTIGIQT
jgi:hypothetical protein